MMCPINSIQQTICAQYLNPQIIIDSVVACKDFCNYATSAEKSIYESCVFNSFLSAMNPLVDLKNDLVQKVQNTTVDLFHYRIEDPCITFSTIVNKFYSRIEGDSELTSFVGTIQDSMHKLFSELICEATKCDGPPGFFPKITEICPYLGKTKVISYSPPAFIQGSTIVKIISVIGIGVMIKYGLRRLFAPRAIG